MKNIKNRFFGTVLWPKVVKLYLDLKTCCINDIKNIYLSTAVRSGITSTGQEDNTGTTIGGNTSIIMAVLVILSLAVVVIQSLAVVVTQSLAVMVISILVGA